MKIRVNVRQINPFVKEDSLMLVAHTDNHSVIMESDHYGKKRALSPMELLLASLGGCSGMDVISILNKMNSPPREFWVELEGERAEEHPRVYTRITVTYRFKGVEKEKAERAVNLSLEKYCSVAAILKRSGVEIVPNVVVEE